MRIRRPRYHVPSVTLPLHRYEPPTLSIPFHCDVDRSCASLPPPSPHLAPATSPTTAPMLTTLKFNVVATNLPNTTIFHHRALPLPLSPYCHLVHRITL